MARSKRQTKRLGLTAAKKPGDSADHASTPCALRHPPGSKVRRLAGAPVAHRERQILGVTPHIAKRNAAIRNSERFRGTRPNDALWLAKEPRP